MDRNKFILALESEGIKTSVHYIPLHIHPYYRDKYNYTKTSFPHAYNYYKSEISLPIYPSMVPKDVEDVVKSIKKLIFYYKR